MRSAPQSLTPAEVRAEKRALALQKAEAEEKRKSDLWASVRRLLKSPSFQVWAASCFLSVISSWLNTLRSSLVSLLCGHQRGRYRASGVKFTCKSSDCSSISNGMDILMSIVESVSR